MLACRSLPLVLMFAPVIASCAFLHNADRAKTATDAVNKFAETEQAVDAAISAISARRTDLLKESLASIDDYVAVTRRADFVIVATARGPLKTVWYENMLLAQLSDIGLEARSAADAKKAVSEVVANSDALDLRALRVAQARTSLRLNLGFDRDLPCDPRVGGLTPAVASSPTDSDAIRQTLARFNSACKALQETSKNLAEVFERGRGGKVLTDLAQARLDEADAETAVAAVEHELAEAKRKLTQADAAAGALPSESLQEAKEVVRGLLEGFGQLARLSGQAALVDGQLAQLNEALTALNSPQAEDPAATSQGAAVAAETERQTRAAVLLAALPDLVDRVAAVESAAGAPSRTTLAIMHGTLLARRDTLAAQVARARGSVELAQASFDALIQELRQLEEAMSLVAHAREIGSTDPLDRDFGALMTGSVASADDERARQAIRLAIVVQVNSLANGTGTIFRNDYLSNDLAYAASEAALSGSIAERRAILGPLIQQQQAFYEGGIRPEGWAGLLAELAKAAGLFAIAAEQ